MSIANFGRNMWVDPALVERAREQLAARSGTPIAQLLPEIRNRLLDAPVVRSGVEHGIVTPTDHERTRGDLPAPEGEEEPIFWEEVSHGD